MSETCRFVADYLQRFGEYREPLDLDRVSEHVAICSSCYDAMSQFFRVMEVPESEYLQESLDDLTEALYNLVKSLVKRPPDPEEEVRENVRFTHEPGDPETYVVEGGETIDDVQDFTGEDSVRGESMDGLRSLMERSQRQFAIAIELLDKAIDLGGRYSLDCLNLKGVLHLTDERLAEAEAAFRAIIGDRGGNLYVRSVQTHAMNNMGYVCQLAGDLDDAIRWAGRAKALAEELGTESFNAAFALMYFHLLRGGPGDEEDAALQVQTIMSLDGGPREFVRCLSLDTNRSIKKLYASSGLATRFPTVS